jgi:hypothetical protein
MDKDYTERLIPVGRQLREELNRRGEHVPSSAMIDPSEGRVWRKDPSGGLQELKADRRRVLSTLEHYNKSVETTRRRCSESRKERL